MKLIKCSKLDFKKQLKKYINLLQTLLKLKKPKIYFSQPLSHPGYTILPNNIYLLKESLLTLSNLPPSKPLPLLNTLPFTAPTTKELMPWETSLCATEEELILDVLFFAKPKRKPMILCLTEKLNKIVKVTTKKISKKKII
jgi:hypothetical protein